MQCLVQIAEILSAWLSILLFGTECEHLTGQLAADFTSTAVKGYCAETRVPAST